MTDNLGDAPKFVVGLIGSKGSGISTLIHRAVTGQFTFQNTIPSTCYVKTTVENRDVILELVHLPADAPPTQLESYDGVALIFSIASTSSYKAIESLSKGGTLSSLLIGTQADRVQERQVKVVQAKGLASVVGCPYIEVSAKIGENVDECFKELAKEVLRRVTTRKFKSTSQSFTQPNKRDVSKKATQQVIRLKKGEMILPFAGASDEKRVKWEKPARSIKSWNEIEPSSFDSTMIDKNCKSKGYLIELGRQEFASMDEIIIEDQDDDIPYYKEELFNKKDHINYIGEHNTIGPVVISIENHTPGHRSRAIVRTKFGNDRLYIPLQYTSSKETIKYIKKNHSKLSTIGKGELKLIPINDISISKDLVDLEAKEISSKCKFGLLYVKNGQTDEDDMFSNVDMSDDFQEFLSFIGEVIDLQGHAGYAGGLDVRNNTTGKQSVYTKFKGMEIMFHVSTMLPFQPDDKQRVERKRHIGNDIVVLIFKEGNQPFDPLVLRSQFNHVFLVIQVEGKRNGNTVYRVSVANKPGVRPYSPFLPHPAIFEKRNDFRDFLLTKLINGQRGAMYSPEFKSKMVSTRRIQLEEIVNRYKSNSSGGNSGNSGKSPSHKLSKSYDEAIDSSITQSQSVVELGKKILKAITQDPKDFDKDEFLSISKEIFIWSVSSEQLTLNKDEQDLVIESARAVTKIGEQFAEMQESRKRGVPLDTTKFASIQANLRDALANFFTSVKETVEQTIDLSFSSPNISRRSLSAPSSPFGMEMMMGFSPSNDTPNSSSKQEIAILVKELIDSTFGELVSCITQSKFEEDHFIELLTSIGKTMTKVAKVVEPPESKQLIKVTKRLLMHGNQLKSEPSNSDVRNDLVVSLKELIKLLKDCTEVEG